MGLLARLFEPQIKAETPGQLSDFWYGPATQASACGVKIDPDTAL